MPVTEPVEGPTEETGPLSTWDLAASLFARWQEGDTEALDALVRCLSPLIWHVVRSCVADRDRAEDVVQTTWLALVRSAEAIQDPQSVAAWLTTTARREAWRATRADSRTSSVADDVIADLAPAASSAEGAVVGLEENACLWRCVQRLDARCQRLLRIVAFDDRPDYAAIARDLEMPVGSIGPTRGRCLAKMRRLLDAESGGRS